MIWKQKINKGENKNNKDVFTLFSLAEKQSSLGTFLLSIADSLATENCCNGKNYSLKKEKQFGSNAVF